MSECVRRETTSALLMKVVSIKWKCKPLDQRWRSQGHPARPRSFFPFWKDQLYHPIHSTIEIRKKREEEVVDGPAMLCCLCLTRRKSLKLPWLCFCSVMLPLWCGFCCCCFFINTSWLPYLVTHFVCKEVVVLDCPWMCRFQSVSV